jgi:hypothetical protein
MFQIYSIAPCFKTAVMASNKTPTTGRISVYTIASCCQVFVNILASNASPITGHLLIYYTVVFQYHCNGFQQTISQYTSQSPI